MSQDQFSEKKDLAYYCAAFSDIKVYKNQKKGGDALNQPILLLSVIDLVTQGLIQENRIPVCDELIETFRKYWSILVHTPFKNSDFALPFFHLKNRQPKFWYLQFSDEYEGGRPQTINTLRQAVNSAKLDDELFAFLLEVSARQVLIDTLISSWFSSSQKELEEILEINQDFQDSTELENISAITTTKTQPKFYLKKSVVRNAFFRKAVVHLYDYRCAFCQLKVIRSISQSIVDGAHIQPFSKNYNSQVNNGISLCKNHHWAFDQGWFSIDDSYRIIVATDLEEESPNAKQMKDYHSETILLPETEKYFPSLEMIKWHRENIFRV